MPRRTITDHSGRRQLSVSMDRHEREHKKSVNNPLGSRFFSHPDFPNDECRTATYAVHNSLFHHTFCSGVLQTVNSWSTWERCEREKTRPIQSKFEQTNLFVRISKSQWLRLRVGAFYVLASALQIECESIWRAVITLLSVLDLAVRSHVSDWPSCFARINSKKDWSTSTHRKTHYTLS